MIDGDDVIVDDDDVMMDDDEGSVVSVLLCLMYSHLIIDDDLIISLSSLKKNRKATFDVLFWGVLNSIIFCIIVCIHDGMGSRI